MKYNQEKCNVLVVDDEVGMTKGVEKTLRKFSIKIDDNKTEVHYNITSALSVEEFYDSIRNRDFDLILLDYKLPNVTGLELLEYIINNMKNTLVIMITAYATFETAVQSTKLGAYDFLAKPFSPDELRGAVKKATTHLILARQARKFEEEKHQIRFQFISVLSHELKAPLNAVEGYLDILLQHQNDFSEDEFKQMLSRSKIRIDGMRKLIFDLLDLTRIESGQKKRAFSEVNLTNLVNSCLELFMYDAEKKNVTIEFITANPILFYSDKSEMEIVLNNLISNAIKYNKDGGQVKIKLKQKGKQVTIIVADSGIGISQEDVKRLFNEFVRIKNEKTMHILGSGLGLSTLKKIAALYNGCIKVRSFPDKGAIFIVKLKEPDSH